MPLRKTTIRASILAMMLTAGPSGGTAIAEEVYMVRGFANVFSRGMDQMTRQLRARGIRARSMSNGEWQAVAEDIIRRSKQGRVSHPIVIAGHSLGGVEAPNFANALGSAGVPVALVIGLDPGFPVPNSFGPGIKHVVNYKIPSGQDYRRGRGFAGKLETIDVSRYGVDHVGIDKHPGVQKLVINRIRKRVGK